MCVMCDEEDEEIMMELNKSVPDPGNRLSDEEIGRRFGFHRATIEGPEATQPRHVLLRRAFLAFIGDLNQLLPPGRYASLAVTAFEEASMWSHKAIAQSAPLAEDPPTETHTEDTLPKVLDTLVDNGLNVAEGREIIQQLQNRGILFREIVKKPPQNADERLVEKLTRGY